VADENGIKTLHPKRFLVSSCFKQIRENRIAAMLENTGIAAVFMCPVGTCSVQTYLML